MLPAANVTVLGAGCLIMSPSSVTVTATVNCGASLSSPARVVRDRMNTTSLPSLTKAGAPVSPISGRQSTHTSAPWWHLLLAGEVYPHSRSRVLR